MKPNTPIRTTAWIITLLFLGIASGWLGYRYYRYRQALAFFGAVFSADSSGRSWRQNLPTNATDVLEWSWSDGFLPDYSYVMKARVSQADFDGFRLALNLTPHTADRQYSDATLWLSWSAPPGFKNTWWDASPSLEATFVNQGSDTWSFAKYENGFLYFQSLNH